MTPEPPASSEGSSLPPRHRPSLDSLAQNTTEKDLWALENEMDLPDDVIEPGARVPRSSGREIPAPRERQFAKPRAADNAAEPQAPEVEDKVRMNVGQRRKGRPSGPPSGPAKPEGEFDDLEHWEDVKLEPEIEELPEEGISEIIEPVAEETLVEVRVEEAHSESAVLASVESVVDDELSPATREGVAPVSLRPHLQLSKVERIGLLVLLVMLVGGGATVFLSSLNRLPTESAKAESQDFPIKGEHVTITSASSYWRAPIREGADADTFRRGTELLPVLELAVSGGPVAIRVLFRGDDQTVVGDAVTRTVHGTGRLKIPATAGFDDPGMHAAYRTGESKPWTIEVYEARTEDALGKDFKKLFEMNISTDRR